MTRSPYVNTGLDTRFYKEKQAMLNPLAAAKATRWLKTLFSEGSKAVSKGARHVAEKTSKTVAKHMPRTSASVRSKFQDLVKYNPEAWANIKKYYKPVLGGAAGTIAIGKLVD